MLSMNENASQSLKSLFVPVVIFMVVQATVLLTWAPLGKGDLNPYLSAIGVVPLQVPFGDFRTISAGVQFVEQGGDPFVDGKYDFMGREFNYPPIWLKFSFLGMSPEAVSYVYFTFASLFSIALMLLFWRETNRAWPVYFLFIFSPPVILALERCNNDLFIFFLIVLAVWIGKSSASRIQNWVAGSLLFLATVLKVFPVFAFYMFLRRSWKDTLMILLPFGLACAAYFVSIKPTLDLIHENTPWGIYLSFGVNVIPSFLADKYPESSFCQGAFPLALMWAIACLGLLAGLLLGKKRPLIHGSEGYEAVLFRTGAAVYIFVFLMGSNYDYRLMFLLLTLPFSFQMVSTEPAQRPWFLCYLVTMFIAVWVNEAAAYHWSGGVLMEAGFLLNELASWVVFFMLVITQFRMLPDFFRKIVYRNSAVS